MSEQTYHGSGAGTSSYWGERGTKILDEGLKYFVLAVLGAGSTAVYVSRSWLKEHWEGAMVIAGVTVLVCAIVGEFLFRRMRARVAQAVAERENELNTLFAEIVFDLLKPRRGGPVPVTTEYLTQKLAISSERAVGACSLLRDNWKILEDGPGGSWIYIPERATIMMPRYILNPDVNKGG